MVPAHGTRKRSVADDDCHVDDYACLFDSEYGFNTTYQAAEKLGSALEGKTVIFTGVSYRFATHNGLSHQIVLTLSYTF